MSGAAIVVTESTVALGDADDLRDIAKSLLPVVASTVDVEFADGSHTEDLELRVEGGPAGPPEGATADVDIAGVTLVVSPLEHEATVPVTRATTTALHAELGGDHEVRRIIVTDLELPRDGDTRSVFDQGGVTVRTPESDDDPENLRYRPVIAIIAAGAHGAGVGPPVRGFPGFGPPDVSGLYGNQLPSGSVGGTASRLRLDCGALPAGQLDLRFVASVASTFDLPSGPLDLKPITFTAGAEVVRAAPPAELRVELGPTSAPVLAWEHEPALTDDASVSLDPALGALLKEQAAAGGDLVVPLRLSCRGPARVRLGLTRGGVTSIHRRHGREPAKRRIAGASAFLAAGLAAGGGHVDVTSRLTGTFGPVRRTGASPSAATAHTAARVGAVVSERGHVACHFGSSALEGRPLVRVCLLGASSGGELVVVLRADAGGPGPLLRPPGVTMLPGAGAARWHTVELDSLPPDDVGDAGVWIVARTNRGRLLWCDGGHGANTAVSADAGITWTPASVAPVVALFVDDPGGSAPLELRAGTASAVFMEGAPVSFDTSVTWPAPLVAAVRATGPGAEVSLDCSRDVELEVSDLAARWSTTVSLGRPA
jgi:hypothetical protein